jgi:glutamyl-tRNA synthetase
MDAKTQEVLDALNAVGARLKEAKSSNGDVSAILAEYQTVKATLEALVRPKAEAAKDSDEALYEALMPAFEKVMTKGEKKKREKELKKKKKAADAGAAAGAGGAKGSVEDGSKQPSKKELKRLEKAKKKAAAKAKAAAEKDLSAGGAATAVNNKQGKGKGKDGTSSKSNQGRAQEPRATAAAPAAAVHDDGVPYAALVVAAASGHTPEITNGTELTLGGSVVLRGSHTIARYLSMLPGKATLYGSDKDPATRCCIDQWIDFSLVQLPSREGMQMLDFHLEGHSYMVGYSITLADIVIWGRLRSLGFSKTDRTRVHVARWFRHCCVLPMFAQFAPADAVPAVVGPEVATVGPDGKLLSKAQIKKARKKALKAAKKAAYKVVGKQSKGATKAKKKKAAAAAGESKSGGDLSINNMGEIEDAVDGEVVTRFPPEPSGFLHIGHAKAVLLNNYFARKYHGKLLVRFDDTNPSKEKVEFEEAILSDLESLGVKPDKISHTSDHFATIMSKAKELLKTGQAYMDDTEQLMMSQQRRNGQPNVAARARKPKENLKIFETMCKGSEEGQRWCMRAKMDESWWFESGNKCMRDPVYFRANVADAHHRTGTKYKAYPTYELACPIVDSIEGVTHAMRSNEYRERVPSYNWVFKALKLRPVSICGFSRVNFNYTLMSKRKLQQLVDAGSVDGWNDPRFPTIQGIKRRGLRIPALNLFLKEIGFGEKVLNMDWDKIWALNRKFIDPTSVRFHAVEQASAMRLTLTNIADGAKMAITTAKHPKAMYAALGHKAVRVSRNILLEAPDCQEIENGEKITLMQWGNVRITKVVKDAASGKITALEGEKIDDADYKGTKKLQWVADTPDKVACVFHEFGYLLNKPKILTDDEGNTVDAEGRPATFDSYLNPIEQTHGETKYWAEAGVVMVRGDDIVQFQRIGFFRCDTGCGPDGNLTPQFYSVPDGKAHSMSKREGKLAHQ